MKLMRISWADHRNTTTALYKSNNRGIKNMTIDALGFKSVLCLRAVTNNRDYIMPGTRIADLLGIHIEESKLDGRTKFAKQLKYVSIYELLDFYESGQKKIKKIYTTYFNCRIFILNLQRNN